MKRILIVDDQPHFSRLLRLMLEKSGEFDVREVIHSVQVAEALLIFRPDLVILDMEMPDKNGAELAHELTLSGVIPASAIVILSGLIEPGESGIKQTPGGPMRFLSKTAPPLQTIRAIQEALSGLEMAA